MNRTFQITIREDALDQLLAIFNNDPTNRLKLLNPHMVQNEAGECRIIVSSLLFDDNDDLVKFNKQGLVIELEEVRANSSEDEDEDNEYLGYR